MTVEATKHLITLSTDISRVCEYCHEWFDGTALQNAVNHYLQIHNCELLHIGPQSSQDLEGKTWHATAAVMGSQEVPPKLESVRFVVKGVAPVPSRD